MAEPFRWHLCRPSRDVDLCIRVTAPNESLPAYLEELRRIVVEQSVDIVLPVSEEALHVVELAASLPPGVRLLSAEKSALAQMHDKFAFIGLSRDLGLAVPETYTADTPEAAALASRSAYVEKPLHSCSGIGLRIAEQGTALVASGADCVVQERLDGELLSSFSLVHKGREIATVFYRGRVFAGTVAICFERVEDAHSAQRWVSEFVAGTAYSGLLAFDFIVGDDGVARAIECNPRATSGVHFFEEASLGQALINPEVCEGIALSPHTRYQWAYSTLTETYAVLFKPREFLRRFREMLRARDALWSLHDPLPFLLMTPMSWEILWPAMTTSQTLGEATQRDIAWFGDVQEISPSLSASRDA